MRRLPHPLIAAAPALPVLLVTAPCAQACDCDRPTPESSIAGSEFIAEVTVLGEEERDGKRVYSLAVERAWKGDPSSQEQVSTESETTACGLQLAEGERYILFAGGSEDEGWSSSWCTATFGVDAEDPPVTRADIEAELGKGTVPDPPPADEVTEDSITPWVVLAGVLVLGLVAVAGGAGAFLLYYRRRSFR